MGTFVGQVKDYVWDRFGLKDGTVAVNLSGRNSVSIHSLECMINLKPWDVLKLN